MSKVKVDRIEDVGGMYGFETREVLNALPRNSNNAPTKRADGSALQFGDKYFNSAEQVEYIFKDTGWVINDVKKAVKAEVDNSSSTIAAADKLVKSGSDKKISFDWIPTLDHSNIYPPSTIGFRFKRTLHSKDAPFNCKADGTDDSDSLVALFTMSRALGGNCEIVIDDGIHGCSKLLQCTSNTTIRFVGSLKCLANPASGTDTILMPVNGASNVTLVNPTIDLNFIPAVNGIICRTGHSGFMSIGGEIKNGRHEKGGTQGGRGAIVESLFTSLNNRAPKFIGLKVVNCYMGFGLQGGNGTATTPVNGGRSLVLIDGLSVDSCDVGIGAFGIQSTGSTNTYPFAADVMQAVISNPAFRNCGKNTVYSGQDGLIVSDRGCNLKILNFAGFNTADYATIDSVVRGNFAKCEITGTFYGNVTNGITFSPYKESDTGPVSENSVQDTDIKIDIHGSVTDFVKGITIPANYILRTNVSGSASSVTSGRVIPVSFAALTSMHFDLYERTQNSRVCGNADQIGNTLFTALPGKKIDLDIGRIGSVDVRGDLKITSFAPREYMVDLSTNAKDLMTQWDSNTLTFATETTNGTDIFDKKIFEYNDATSVGLLYSNGNAVFRWSADTIGLLRIKNYTNDTEAATGGVAVGELYRNGNVIQIRIA